MDPYAQYVHRVSKGNIMLHKFNQPQPQYKLIVHLCSELGNTDLTMDFAPQFA